MDDDIPYLLLTPGPLTTSKTVKQAMMQDYCTWDDDYNRIVTDIGRRLVRLAGGGEEPYVRIDAGQRDFCRRGDARFGDRTRREAARGEQRRLRPAHGADRPAAADRSCGARTTGDRVGRPGRMDEMLCAAPAITHVAMVHCETTTGLLNPAAAVGDLVRKHRRIYILDAMSSFAGVPMTVQSVGHTTWFPPRTSAFKACPDSAL